MPLDNALLEGLEGARVALIRELSTTVKTLIETKHLYQRLTVDAEGIVNRHVVARETKIAEALGATAARNLLAQRIVLVDPPFDQYDDGGNTNMLFLEVGNVKTFCAACDDAEVAAPVWFNDVVDEANKPRVAGMVNWRRSTPSHQVFVFAYQCQRCKGEYQVFTIRRATWHFSLDGRSPIEHVDVPAFIPKVERGLYRDALIASHGGKTLAAIFYLRCFIEQFGRRQTRMTGKVTGDEILTAYSTTLPAGQRDFMPSLKVQCDLLSEAIHSVRDDAALFERCRKEVEKHFDIRRVYQVPDASVQGQA
jgi:hypothetical protein